uniref:Uncharacterized protein n=1 Tax=Moniliophthora roreri TaxID=221103 RepID=A0A0W0FLG6_MONRR
MPVATSVRGFHSFTSTLSSRKAIILANDPEHEHEHHSLIIPQGDSLPQDRNPHKSNEDSKNGNLAQDFTDIPPPIPDSGSRTSYSRTTLQPYTPFLGTHTSLSSSLHSVTSPTTLTVTDSYHFPTLVASSSSSSVSPSSSSDSSLFERQNADSSAHKTPISIIIAVPVGLVVFIGGGILLLRACTRPRRRDRPKPSLPILDDPFPEEESYKSKESPLFGGKERFSSQNPNSGTLPPWTQYPQVTVILPTQSPMSVAPDVHPSFATHTTATQGLLAPRPPPSQSVPTLGPSFISGSSSHQATIGNSTNRLSTATRSISVYPNSPACSQDGFAAESAANPPLTDVNRCIAEPNTEAADNRSLLNTTHRSVSRDGVAYDGADLISPQFVAQDFGRDSPMPSVGRSRIKSSYTPGSYPRMSSVPSMLNSMKTRPTGGDDMRFDLRRLPPIHKLPEKTNMGMSSVLEMTSPSVVEEALLSPQPTLYPDDSLSVVCAKRFSGRRLYRKPTPKHQRESEPGTAGLTTPPIDSGTVLGNLMLMEFGASSKSTGLTEGFDLGTSPMSSKAGSISKTGPPRVPSPPALPSLAQMGLEHANPEAYAEYRSATYSICGLYESDRKSKIN